MRNIFSYPTLTFFKCLINIFPILGHPFSYTWEIFFYTHITLSNVYEFFCDIYIYNIWTYKQKGKKWLMDKEKTKLGPVVSRAGPAQCRPHLQSRNKRAYQDIGSSQKNQDIGAFFYAGPQWNLGRLWAWRRPTTATFSLFLSSKTLPSEVTQTYIY